MKPKSTVLVSAFALCAASPARAAAPRDAVDERELAAMAAKSPHAVELFEKGEALADSGALAEAERLFLKSHREYPDGSILWRRDCEALTALGRRNEAILACSSAVGAYRSNTNMRALVSSLIDGPAAPTTTQLSQALLIAATEHERGSPLTAAAATCDIAEKIGDEVMLQGCAEELERIAPDDHATQEAVTRLDARCPPWRFWGGWGAILAALVGTAGHAFGRRARRRSKRAPVVALAALALAVGSWPGAAYAADDAKPTSNWLSKWPVDDANPDAHIPSEQDRNADPLQFGYWLQDVSLKGEHASKHGDHAAAARFYETLAKAVPDRAIGFVKACEEYDALGDREKAVALCGDALLRDGLRVQDYSRFVHLVLAKVGPLTDKETAALGQVLQHMREDPGGAGVVDDLECEVGTRTQNVAQLKECTAGLAARAPDDAKTISYEWALAAASGNTREADALLQQASAAGVAPADIERMRKETASRRMRHALRVTGFTVAVGLLLAGMAMALRHLMARRRLAAPVVPGSTQPSA